LASHTKDARRRIDDDTTVEEDIVIEALKDFPDNVIAIACPWACDQG